MGRCRTQRGAVRIGRSRGHLVACMGDTAARRGFRAVAGFVQSRVSCTGWRLFWCMRFSLRISSRRAADRPGRRGAAHCPGAWGSRGGIFYAAGQGRAVCPGELSGDIQTWSGGDSERHGVLVHGVLSADFSCAAGRTRAGLPGGSALFWREGSGRELMRSAEQPTCWATCVRGAVSGLARHVRSARIRTAGLAMLRPRAFRRNRFGRSSERAVRSAGRLRHAQRPAAEALATRHARLRQARRSVPAAERPQLPGATTALRSR